MASPLIICNNVVKIYRSGKVKVTALRGLNLKVKEGEFRAIVGPSGSGKTTLLNLIGGMDKPDAGEIIVDGEDISKYDEKKLYEYRLRKVGFVFQFFNLIPTLTALENVELPMILAGYPREKRLERAKMLLKRVGLGDKMDRRPGELSGGEQQRVAIAVALANDPPIILADEPTGELDTATSREIAELFRELHREMGKTIIIVTHDLSIAMYAEKISRMEDGRIIMDVTPAEMETYVLAPAKTAEIVARLEARKREILEEISKLEHDFKSNLIDAETFVNRYMELKSILEHIDTELKKYTLT
ncbi:MAG: ABC transporter ATP-binding protein [Candidatus Njordarchaeales archaeon]